MEERPDAGIMDSGIFALIPFGSPTQVLGSEDHSSDQLAKDAKPNLSESEYVPETPEKLAGKIARENSQGRWPKRR